MARIRSKRFGPGDYRLTVTAADGTVRWFSIARSRDGWCVTEPFVALAEGFNVGPFDTVRNARRALAPEIGAYPVGEDRSS